MPWAPVVVRNAGDKVEAYHPMRHRTHIWEPATIVSPATEMTPYVTVRWDDGTESTTFHLNVREPGAVDPVSLL